MDDSVTDAELLARLGHAARLHDPVPEGVVEAALGAFAWLTIDAELAELVEDSASSPLSTVRGHGGPRMLTFEAGDASVVVEVTPVGSRRRMMGQLVNERASSIDVRHVEGILTVPVDQTGRFAVDGVPPGPVSLVCSSTGAPSRRVVTAWVTL